MGAILLAAFALLMAIGVPIFVALGAGTMIAMLVTNQYSVVAATHRMVSGVDSYILLAIPFFILAAQLMNTGGITKRLFRFASALGGHIPGGLAHANVLASVIFSGMSGSAVADAGGLGQIELQAMEDEGFPKDFSASVTVASATVGPIIPPSIPMVVYAAAAEVSVGTMFIGGIIPGLVLSAALMLYIYIVSKKRGYPKREKFDWKELWVSFKEAFFPLLTPVLIIGGILGGWYTPTEAAVIATVYAFILGFIVYREITTKELINMVITTVKTTATTVVIIGAANAFAWGIALENIPVKVTEYLTSITTNPYLVVLMLNIIFLALGCFMESLSVLLIVTPFLLPLMKTFGLSPVHMGIVLVLNLMIGLATPPVGMSLFVVAKLAKIKLHQMYKAILPFLVPMIAILLLISYLPDLTLWLPKLILGR